LPFNNKLKAMASAVAQSNPDPSVTDEPYDMNVELGETSWSDICESTEAKLIEFQKYPHQHR
jgi:uncharacterized protein (DUF362 family)